METSITAKFSSRLRQVLVAAEETAESLGHAVVDTDHLLLTLRIHKGSVAAEILKSGDISVERLRANVQKNHASKTGGAQTPLYTGQAKRAVIKATWTAGQNRHHFVGTEHLLAALLSQRDSQAKKVLSELKVNVSRIRHQLRLVLRGTTNFPDITETLQLRSAPVPTGDKTRTPLLDEFGLDLNAHAAEHKIDPVIGRSTELARIVDVLERRTKNNVMLVGEPGVGKTAIIEGLAYAIVHGQVTKPLADKRIVQLDMAGLLSGTSYRGDFEERLRCLLEEVQRAGNVIIFIDEIHTIVGTGSVGGSLDTANMLKTALAKGAIRIIGATTPQEFKQHIERDPALERRFLRVAVPELTVHETLRVLKEAGPLYEQFHGVRVSPEAQQAAVELSVRYLPERFLPDKALDLIDEAMSHAKVRSLAETSAHATSEQQVSNLEIRTERLIQQERYDEALRQRHQIARLRVRTQPKIAARATPLVTPDDVAAIVARTTSIPVEQIMHTDGQRLAALERTLRKNIIGQRHAITAVVDTLLRSRSGIADPKRPLGTFLFMGPSGVGKTELTKQLAQTYFGRSEAFIRLDMSEFGERHMVSRLLGSPPGYIGYGEGGRLTEAVRRTPYSVVLFDEIEKAHPEILNILLQLFEEGQLTDAGGKTVDFKNTICVLTSNIGNRYGGRGELIGFTQNGKVSPVKHRELDLKRALQDQLRPELLGRIDKVLAFHPLTEAELRRVFTMEIAKLTKRLPKQVKLSIDPAVLTKALRERNPDTGARFIRTFIQDHIEPQLARQRIARPELQSLCVRVDQEKIVLSAT
ncbi:MAG: ATP-dependent Clp protease ATP-binding subunit [bacterium]|nr:ATP-dependent Clp protease ATP-binding subunit [bacterium]